jgi:predicted glutamine amidotransferase
VCHAQSPTGALQRRFHRIHEQSRHFTEHTRETDRVAVVVTAPLTTDEAWVAFEPGRLYTFEGGDCPLN